MSRTIHINTTVSRELAQLAKEHHISWAEVIRVGMSMILYERGVEAYDNKLVFFRVLEDAKNKMLFYKNSFEKLSQTLNDKIDKTENITKETGVSYEVDRVIGG